MELKFQILFSILLIVVAECALLPTIKQNGGAKMRNVNALYEGSFNLTLENILEFRFSEKNEYYKIDTNLFPLDDASGMVWYFRTEVRTRRSVKELDVMLTVQSLPKDATYLFATCESFVVGANGIPQLKRNNTETILSSGVRFYVESVVKRDDLVSRASELLVGGNLNLQFNVKGFFVYKAEAVALLDKI